MSFSVQTSPWSISFIIIQMHQISIYRTPFREVNKFFSHLIIYYYFFLIILYTKQLQLWLDFLFMHSISDLQSSSRYIQFFNLNYLNANPHEGHGSISWGWMATYEQRLCRNGEVSIFSYIWDSSHILHFICGNTWWLLTFIFLANTADKSFGLYQFALFFINRYSICIVYT